mmetsp:Transcript_1989/g.4449  ORF Transcript_1989/g.4449 Transcript_1989/m.4449 type:complete len:99 (-) Transcript_1989:2584-2880(-)
MTLTPSAQYGGDTVHCLLVKDCIFVKADNTLTRTSVSLITELAKEQGASTLYACTYREAPDFLKTVKMLLFVGFKQVQPALQRTMFRAPGVMLKFELV